jgi:hypothetical protein
MSVPQQRQIDRLALSGRPLHPRWIAVLFGLGALVLAPWVVYLLLSLPDEALADHWRLAWSGFDLGLAASFALMAITIARRSSWVPVSASSTATLLCSDAWFDVLTAHGEATFRIALCEALLVELPMAAICLYVARDRALRPDSTAEPPGQA